jgi:hypothetical protein
MPNAIDEDRGKSAVCARVRSSVVSASIGGKNENRPSLQSTLPSLPSNLSVVGRSPAPVVVVVVGRMSDGRKHPHS